jgi:hypothetical protein
MITRFIAKSYSLRSTYNSLWNNLNINKHVVIPFFASKLARTLDSHGLAGARPAAACLIHGAQARALQATGTGKVGL